MEEKALLEHYQLLATAIVKTACADYIDALIVKRQGYISEEILIRKIFREIIAYGKKRYLIQMKNGQLKRRPEYQNLRQLEKIKELLNHDKRREMAEYDIRECEKFFKSGIFAILMPNTDVDWLITQLKLRAIHHERIITGYESRY